MGSKIDAVTVSTPDHHHAAAAVRAMRLGKHVYCQKPLTHSVWEARLMRETAREKGVCTQMGNQGTAHPGFRRGVEVIRSGAIGEIREVHVWTNRPFKYWKQAPDIVARPTATPGIPNHIHWYEFLGPAPDRPYHPVYHPHDWRGWWDFGTGALGDMACHTTNLAFMVAEAGLPTRVSRRERRDQLRDLSRLGDDHLRVPAPGQPAAGHPHLVRGGEERQANLPSADLFPGRIPVLRQRFAVRRLEGQAVLAQRLLSATRPSCPSPTSGLQGSRARLCRGSRDTTTRTTTQEGVGRGHPARASRRSPSRISDYASTLTESMLLGNVAVRSGEAIDYDPATGRITNSSDRVPVPEALLPQGLGDLSPPNGFVRRRGDETHFDANHLE